MHPWPNHGEACYTTESGLTSNSGLEEVRKRMARVRAGAMEKGLTTPAIDHDGVSTEYLASTDWDDHIHGAGCTCNDKERANIGRFCSVGIWPPIKARASLDWNTMANGSDAFSIEEKGEVKSDVLPWSDTLNSTTATRLSPHPCNAECWHKDPVEVAARRYECAGRFQDASKLRVNFRGLSILHRRVLQWYRWAEEQWALKGPPKEETLDTSSVALNKNRQTQNSSRAISTSLEGAINIEEPFHGTEFLSKISGNTIAKDFVLQASDSPAVNSGQWTDGMHRITSLNRPARQLYQVDPSPSKSNGTQPRIFNTERIISQQVKDKIFRNGYPKGFKSNTHSKDTHTKNDRSIAYRNHARWVLESNIMSDDSEDDSSGFASPYEVAHLISPERPQEIFTGKSSGNPAKRDSPKTSWDDLFFFADSDSSDYRSSEILDDGGFPIISGEELGKLLEEAKGTMQFHKWQNASAGEHQKEFKTLINLHRFSREAEAKNQKRWRSGGQAEDEAKAKTNTIQNHSPTKIFYQPSFGLENEPEPSHIQSSNGTTLGPEPEPDLPTHTISTKSPSFSQKSSKHLEPKLQPVDKESEDYYHITADDVKFLRGLKKKLEHVEVIRQTETTTDAASPSCTVFHDNKDKISQIFNESQLVMAMRKSMEYDRSKSGEITITGLSEKSLRDVLRTAKPLLGVSHGTEYENWFPRDHLADDRANGHPELSRIYHDGPTPKRHHLTGPSGDVSFRPGSAEYHPFSQATQSVTFKKLVMSTGKFWNPRADIFLSGFWATENLFITTLNFHPWAPSTTIKTLHNQIEDFKSRNEGIELFVFNSWFSSSDDPKIIKVVLRAWDTSARIAIFQTEDKTRASPNFVGVDMLIEEDAAYGHNGAHIATIGYNPSDIARGDPLGLRLLTPGSRSVTFGQITISEGYSENKIHSPPVFARLEPGFSHGSYGRMCIIMDTDQKNSIVGLVTGQCEERGLRRPEAISDFVSTFPDGFKDELRRISIS